ncbi:TonB-dependent receptor [Bowmanella denitrificans]|uniref:TonB-dependent receptor n=1 Tax=Bowmanella denitrificans TaxID=366582 RepID=UPI000C9B59E6|nr:TonB-dependent receptor [Bowmanella denitrificans]
MKIKPLSVAIFTSLLACGIQASEIERLEIRSERMHSELNSIARQVSVIDQQTLQLEFASANNLADVLAKLVPGMAPPSPALTNFGTTLRGRNALVLIDGVPMNTNRNISRDLHNIAPSQVERIEVFRGGNAVFGSGATGGVIYIHTRSGSAQNSAQTQLSSRSSLTDFGRDSTSMTLAHQQGGSNGNWRYQFGGSLTQHQGFYDADGDMIAPEPSQGDESFSDILSLTGKLQRQWHTGEFVLSALYHNLEQDSEYASDPSVNTQPYISKAKAIKGLQLDKQNTIRNLVLNTQLRQTLTADHKLSAQLYHRDYAARFYPFDGRPFATWNHLAQTYLDSQTTGARLTLTSSLSHNLELDWGLDLSREKTAMPVTVYDGDTYDRSAGLVFIEAGEKDFVPDLTHSNQAAFVQGRYQFSPDWTLEAGLRHEKIKASFEDFTTLGSQTQIHGSEYDYSATVHNLALTWQVNDNHSLYIANNEGFELPDIGLQVRYAASAFDLRQSNLSPVETDDFELGWRGNIAGLSISAALFRSESDLGGVVSQNMGLSLKRNQVRIKGFEASAAYDFNDQWRLDLSYSHASGEEKAENAEHYQPMYGFSIAPDKLAASLQYTNQNGWQSQLRITAVMDQDYRINGANAFGRRDVQGYQLLDLSSHLPLGDGMLTLALENLLNEDYFPLYSQLQRSGKNDTSLPGRGRMLSVSYQYHW